MSFDSLSEAVSNLRQVQASQLEKRPQGAEISCLPEATWDQLAWLLTAEAGESLDETRATQLSQVKWWPAELCMKLIVLSHYVLGGLLGIKS